MKQARPLSERTMRFAMFLVRLVPRWLGYPLAEWASRMFARLAPTARGIVESNLRPVLGTDDPHRLREVAIQVFGHAGRAYYEMFYLPSSPREKITALMNMEEPGWTRLQEIFRQGRGIILTSTHQSSFDLAGQAIAAHGFPMLVIALPDQDEGFAFMNRLRLFQGVQVIPAGPRALREAIRTLREGKIVVMGGDRPIKGQGTMVQFFGRPTLLPDGPVRLAMHTGAALMLAACRREQGQYWLHFQEFELIRSGDDEADVHTNAQRLALAMELVIRAHPEQWHLLLKLWEE
jgi:KDO2-lipid IV(A) lauroyltransferase